LVVLRTSAWTSGALGSVLVINTFGTTGQVGHFIAAISLMLFTASSSMSMSTRFGVLAWDMFGTGLQHVIQILVVIGCFVGSTVGVDAVLPWVDMTNMFPILYNMDGQYHVPDREAVRLDTGLFQQRKRQAHFKTFQTASGRHRSDAVCCLEITACRQASKSPFDYFPRLAGATIE